MTETAEKKLVVPGQENGMNLRPARGEQTIVSSIFVTLADGSVVNKDTSMEKHQCWIASDRAAGQSARQAFKTKEECESWIAQYKISKLT